MDIYPPHEGLDLGEKVEAFTGGQKLLNRYKLDRVLGHGGMGVVWLARDKCMKLKFSIAISMLLFALFTFAANAQAQTVKPQQIPNKLPPQAALPKPSLFGVIQLPVISEAKLSAFRCSDLTVVVGIDAKTAAGTGVSIPYLQAVASAKAAKINNQCTYRVSSMPVGTFKVELQVTNQDKFDCDLVQLNYTHSPLKSLQTITFKADSAEERNFQVTSIKCTIVK